MFMPQRPYMPLGTLRQALCYPSGPDRFTDEEIAAAMERCQLGDFIDRLDQEDRWDKSLSLGQQQRVAFARVLMDAARMYEAMYHEELNKLPKADTELTGLLSSVASLCRSMF